MRGDPQIIEELNERLVEEYTAVNQYLAHRAALRVWEYPKLVDYLDERIADERKHFDLLAERIVFLGGQLCTGQINTVNVGEYVRQMHGNDLASELDAVDKYRVTIRLCLDKGDTVTRTILESILADEEDHVLDLEAQIEQMAQMTPQNYLSAKI